IGTAKTQETLRTALAIGAFGPAPAQSLGKFVVTKMAEKPVPALPEGDLYWHVETFGSLDEARAAIGGLRPPVLDDLGLAGGLTSLARSLPQLPVAVDVAEVRLPEARELALYRIAQEALQNVVKHSGATHARLTFTVADGTARLDIVDDGRGFDADEKSDGYGMHSMAERADLVGGTLAVRSRPGTGTSVCVTVPMPTTGSEPGG
ncbi:MAG: sensor histidine kinase, partial [Actinomycetia bacterium]|nr:sensor histidine kinase [Actinomycetes bacterium]